MELSEKDSSESRLTESNPLSFQHELDNLRDAANSIISFALQWDDIESHLESTNSAIEARYEQLRGKESLIDLGFRQLEKQKAEWEFVRSSLEEREERVFMERASLERERKECDRCLEELRVRESEIEGKRKECDRNFEELRRKEREIEEMRKGLEVKERECEEKLEELERGKKSGNVELELKEKEVKERQKGLEVKERECEKKLEELVGLKQSVNEALKSKEREVEERRKGVALKENVVKDSRKENHVEKKRKELELKEKYLEERFRVLRSSEMDLENRNKELELKEKQLELQFRETEFKEEKIEPLKSDNVNADADVSFSVKIDGKGLQMFLNESKKDHESLRNEVIDILSLALDPAKLVLDAMQGFFPPHLRKGEMEFKEDVVRKSCIFLLEQLQKISLKINPHVKMEAKELAVDWKRKMTVVNDDSMEVLGFLQFLAAYGLASEFDADDLLRYLQIVAKDDQAPELFRNLGLAAHISSFIEKLTNERKLIEAIDFLYAFGLVSEFSPVPLLKDFLKSSKPFGKKVRKKIKDINEQIEAADQRLVDVKAVLKCVEDYSIVSDISTKHLKHLINNLEKQISEMKTKLSTPACTAPTSHLDLRPQSSWDIVATVTSGCDPKSAFSASPKVESTATACPATKTLSHQQTGCKRPHTAIAGYSSVPLAELSSQNLAGSSGVSSELSGKHGNLDSRHHENSNALKLELEPAEYALDAIQRFCSLEQRDKKSVGLDISEERCISLLDDVRKLPSHSFDPHVKAKALKFAVFWKARLMEKRHGESEIVLFVEFLAAYGLTNSFPANDLLFLLDSNFGHKTASDLCQTLGLADRVPDFVESLIQRNRRIEAAKYVHLLGMNDTFPIIRLLSDHWNYSMTIGQRLCEKYDHSITAQIEATREEIDALRAIVNCLEAFNLQFQGPMSHDNLRKRIVQLEKQNADKEVLNKVTPSARSDSISLQQEKKSANCSTETTPNTELSAPAICPSTTVASAPVTSTSPSPGFASVPVRNQVTVSSPATCASTGTPVRGRIINLPQNTPTRKLNFGSSPSPTGGPSASKTVAQSSTGSHPSPAVSKTQPRQQTQNKRRKKAASSGPPFKPKHSNSTINYPMQPPLHQPIMYVNWPHGYYMPYCHGSSFGNSGYGLPMQRRP